MKSRTRFRLRFDPDASSVVLDDLLTNCQSHTRAAVVAGAMQTAEHSENLLPVLSWNSMPLSCTEKIQPDPFDCAVTSILGETSAFRY